MEYLIVYLEQLELMLPCAPFTHHTFTKVDYGSDETGWAKRLCLGIVHLPNDRICRVESAGINAGERLNYLVDPSELDNEDPWQAARLTADAILDDQKKTGERFSC